MYHIEIESSHMKEFIPTAIGDYLESQGIEYGIYLGHQCDEHLFNRGVMKNVDDQNINHLKMDVITLFIMILI